MGMVVTVVMAMVVVVRVVVRVGVGVGVGVGVIMAMVALRAMHMGRVCVAVVVRMVMGVAAPVLMVVRLPVIVSMPMGMPARRIGATLGFECAVLRTHDQVHGPQHVGQHVVGLDLQVVGLQFDGHMAVAQVIGRASEVKWRAVLRTCRNAKQCLRCSFNANQTTIIGDQHIATANHMSALQKYRQHTTR